MWHKTLIAIFFVSGMLFGFLNGSEERVSESQSCTDALNGFDNASRDVEKLLGDGKSRIRI